MPDLQYLYIKLAINKNEAHYFEFAYDILNTKSIAKDFR